MCPGTGRYYVTVTVAGRVGFLLGPYLTHEDALANVKRGKALADKADPWSHFYAFGTVAVTDPTVNPKVVFGS